MRFVPQLALAWQSQARESMVIDAHPSKFRKHHFWTEEATDSAIPEKRQADLP